MAGPTFGAAFRAVEEIKNRENTVVLFPKRFEVDRQKFDKMSKSLEWLAKADSQPALRSASAIAARCFRSRCFNSPLVIGGVNARISF